MTTTLNIHKITVQWFYIFNDRNGPNVGAWSTVPLAEYIWYAMHGIFCFHILYIKNIIHLPKVDLGKIWILYRIYMFSLRHSHFFLFLCNSRTDYGRKTYFMATSSFLKWMHEFKQQSYSSSPVSTSFFNLLQNRPFYKTVFPKYRLVMDQ